MQATLHLSYARIYGNRLIKITFSGPPFQHLFLNNDGTLLLAYLMVYGVQRVHYPVALIWSVGKASYIQYSD